MNSGPTWSKVPREAFEDDRLSRLQLRVLGILASHADAKGFCTRRQEAIGEETGVKRESVNRAIARLVALGYVERIQRPGMKRSLRYRVLIADGARGQLSLFDRADTPRGAKAMAGDDPRCDPNVTTDVTPAITSVVTLEVTAINEQPPVNRGCAERAAARDHDRQPGDAARPVDPGPLERGPVANDRGVPPLEDAPFLTPADNRAPPRGDLDAMEARLREAGGAALMSASPGLLDLSAVFRWIGEGCDFERDIVSAITGRARSHRGSAIRTWAYFEGAVMDARDRRLALAERGRAPPPSVHSNVVELKPGGPHGKPRFSAADHIARRRAQFGGE